MSTASSRKPCVSTHACFLHFLVKTASWSIGIQHPSHSPRLPGSSSIAPTFLSAYAASWSMGTNSSLACMALVSMSSPVQHKRQNQTGIRGVCGGGWGVWVVCVNGWVGVGVVWGGVGAGPCARSIVGECERDVCTRARSRSRAAH